MKVPRELPAEQACLIGCAVATGVMSVLETAKVWEGARVAVIGCGAVGLSAIQGARLAGASRSARSTSTSASSSRRCDSARRTRSGPVDFVFESSAAGRRSSRVVAARDRRHAHADRPLARR